MNWIRLALVGSLSVGAHAGAWAQDWDHDVNIGLAVAAFLAVYQSGGIDAARGLVTDCYRSVDAIAPGDGRLNRFEYCAALDFAGYLTDRRAAEAQGTGQSAYFAVDQIRSRLERLSEWVDDPLTQQQILKAWAATSARSLDAAKR